MCIVCSLTLIYIVLIITDFGFRRREPCTVQVLWEGVHVQTQPNTSSPGPHGRETVPMYRLLQAVQRQQQLEGAHGYPFQRRYVVIIVL